MTNFVKKSDLNFKNGKLYIFRKSKIIVIRPWGKNAGAWIKYYKSGSWKTCNPFRYYPFNHKEWDYDKQIFKDFCPELLETDDLESFRRERNMLFPAPEDALTEEKFKYFKHYLYYKRKYLIYKEFQKLIPSEIIGAVVKYDKQHWWRVLQLFNRVPGIMDLHKSTPALVIALAYLDKFKSLSKPKRACRSLMKKKQTTILKYIGFPAEPWIIKLLRKIPILDLSPALLKLIQANISDYKFWQHLSWIAKSEYTWMLLRNGLSTNIIHQLEKKSQKNKQLYNKLAHNLFTYITDCKRMSDKLDSEFIMDNLSTLKEITKAHDALSQKYLHRQKLYKSVEFPAPPIPVTTGISYIDNLENLDDESFTMRHCVASYEDEILSGKYAVYHMTQPERCTIGISTNWKGMKIDQIKGFANGMVSKETMEIIERWFTKM